jgi:hypothetical protein
MENIVDINNEYDFGDIVLENPYPLQGGNFYTKISHTLKKIPLYVQLPRCKTKNGIVRNISLKKSYCDLMFSSYNTDLITWMENLESKCRELIYNKKDIWFQNEMSLDDIENVFISPTKSYKSGKFAIMRVHIPSTKQIKKDCCMIYDENEQMLEMDDVKETTEIIPLVCINGIKFSSKSFQLDITLPQLMVITVEDSIKNEIMIKSGKNPAKVESLEISRIEKSNSNENNLGKMEELGKLSQEENKEILTDQNGIFIKEDDENRGDEEKEAENRGDEEKEAENRDEEEKEAENRGDEEKEAENKEDEIERKEVMEGIREIELDVGEISDSISIKRPNEVYFEIYREARDKARHMRKAAVEAYLEARSIKNKYNIDDMDDSEDNISNLSEEEDEEKPN